MAAQDRVGRWWESQMVGKLDGSTVWMTDAVEGVN